MMHIRRSRSPLGILGVALVAAVIVAACGGGGSNPDGVDGGTLNLDVTVLDDGLDPSSLTLQVPSDVMLTIHNGSTTACSFSFGTFAEGIDVEPGGEHQVEFTSFSSTQNPEPGRMGCDGDSTRVGTVEYQVLTVSP